MRGIRPALVLLLSILTFGPAGSVYADSPGLYTWDDHTCGPYLPPSTGVEIDPVTVELRDPNQPYLSRALTHMDAAGWTNRSGTVQWGWDGIQCKRMEAQRATRCPVNLPIIGTACGRHHARFWSTVNDIPNLIAKVTPHVEDLIVRHDPWFLCHAVKSNGPEGSGYEQGKVAMRSVYGQYTAYYPFWGNTKNFPQCDGDIAGNADGRVFYITTQGGSF